MISRATRVAVGGVDAMDTGKQGWNLGGSQHHR